MINRSQIPYLLLPGLAGLEWKYPQLPRRYTEFLSVGTSEMALERWVEMSPTSLARLKAEGTATFFDNSPGQRFVYNIEHHSYGLGFSITREALEDNLYKQSFHPMAMGLLQSFAQTEEIVAASVLNLGQVYNPSIGADGVPLFSTAHPIDVGTYANTSQVPLQLNESALETVLTNIRYIPDQKGLIQFFRGRKLIVPPYLQWTAERLLKSQYRTGTADNDISAIVSSGALPEGYAVDEFLTNPNAWFVITNVDGGVFLIRTPFEINLDVDTVTQNLLVVGYMRFGVGYKNPRFVWGEFPINLI
jgi:hypothetical protein